MSRLDIKTPSRAQTVVEGLYRDMERRIAASPPGLCPVDMSLSFLQLCHAQTCGKCVPCRIGLGQLTLLINQVLDGEATMETIAIIEKTARSIVNTADCAIGRDAARLVVEGLEGFRDDYEEHVKHNRCLAGLQNPVPCVALCPAGVDIPGYIALVRAHRYDDAVRLANRMGKEHGWILVQDTAWPGYEEIPAWIMEGYTTIAWELFQQLEDLGGQMPTHLFLQAGVGSFAGAILGSFAARLGKDCPITCIVEPDRADCLYRSARAADGKIHPVTGEMNSMMAGLCCGEPCTISWEIISPGAAAFLSCSDEYSAMGMRLLGRPEPGDPAVVSGESGAVGVGVLSAILHEEKLEDLRWSLGLNESSRVLCISTEGDTDQANYQKIVGERV